MGQAVSLHVCRPASNHAGEIRCQSGVTSGSQQRKVATDTVAERPTDRTSFKLSCSCPMSQATPPTNSLDEHLVLLTPMTTSTPEHVVLSDETWCASKVANEPVPRPSTNAVLLDTTIIMLICCLHPAKHHTHYALYKLLLLCMTPPLLAQNRVS